VNGAGGELLAGAGLSFHQDCFIEMRDGPQAIERSAECWGCAKQRRSVTGASVDVLRIPALLLHDPTLLVKDVDYSSAFDRKMRRSTRFTSRPIERDVWVARSRRNADELQNSLVLDRRTCAIRREIAINRTVIGWDST
jgi:hypothetical protein